MREGSAPAMPAAPSAFINSRRFWKVREKVDMVAPGDLYTRWCAKNPSTNMQGLCHGRLQAGSTGFLQQSWLASHDLRTKLDRRRHFEVRIAANSLRPQGACSARTTRIGAFILL